MSSIDWLRTLTPTPRRGAGSALLVLGALVLGAAALGAGGALLLGRPSLPAPLSLVGEGLDAPPAEDVVVLPPPVEIESLSTPAPPAAVLARARAERPAAEVAASMPEPAPAASEVPLARAVPGDGLSGNGVAADPPGAAPPVPLPIVLPAPSPGPTPVKPLPPPGQPVRLTIPSIGVDTPVVELGVTFDPAGGLQWETAPFVAGHYLVTGLVGAKANVVLSGHVLTRDMGNVFRDLYKVRRGAPIVVRTDKGEFTYRVAEVRVVKPWEIDVLAPSGDPRLTLVTCAGYFDVRSRTFSDRLIVVGDLVTGEY